MATPIPQNEARFSADEVAAATGGELLGPKWAAASGVVTDSRAVREGNLFVALSGDRFDGHAFTDRAVEAGAAAVVVEKPIAEGFSAVRVRDTLVALGDLANAHRLSWGGRVIGITGSAGKTTTKELVAAVVAGAGESVLSTAGNLNNRVGVPLTLLQLRSEHTAAVIEMGTSEPGEIATLGAIASPDLALLTLVAAAHTEGLGTVEAVAREKTSLFQSVGESGCIVALGDDDRIREAATAATVKECVFFGTGAKNDVRLEDWSVSTEGTKCEFNVRGKRVAAQLQLLGEGAALGSAAALAVAVALRLDIDRATESLASVGSIAGRMSLCELGEHWFVDDSYNANPASMRVAIDTASKLAAADGRRLVVALGDMKELGDLSESAHVEVAGQLKEANVAYAILCGPDMQQAFAVLGAAGIACDWYDDASEVEPDALERVQDGDLILVKGSRSMEMERVIEALSGRADR